MSTRCPPKRVSSAEHFFYTLQAHHAATSELQRRRTTQLWAAYRQACRCPSRLQGLLVRGAPITPIGSFSLTNTTSDPAASAPAL
ncbi:UNVERIFIED_CONTAM: hypothetical protein FKN15_060507 [Acipenser sinensis]